MTNTSWTHTAIVTRLTKVGPRQCYQFEESNVRPGTRVELYQDPAQQEGDLITIRVGHNTGAARLVDLAEVEAK